MESFVVRIWVPAEAESRGVPFRLLGFVEHVGAGRPVSFRGRDELLALVEAGVERTMGMRRPARVPRMEEEP